MHRGQVGGGVWGGFHLPKVSVTPIANITNFHHMFTVAPHHNQTKSSLFGIVQCTYYTSCTQFSKNHTFDVAIFSLTLMIQPFHGVRRKVKAVLKRCLSIPKDKGRIESVFCSKVRYVIRFWTRTLPTVETVPCNTFRNGYNVQ